MWGKSRGLGPEFVESPPLEVFTGYKDLGQISNSCDFVGLAYQGKDICV
jgi:hypothetical protein